MTHHPIPAETIEKLPTFRGIWQRHRCLIPASGYYEWHRIAVMRGALCIECRACGRRTALTRDNCSPIHPGNKRKISDAKFRCSGFAGCGQCLSYARIRCLPYCVTPFRTRCRISGKLRKGTQNGSNSYRWL